MTSPEVEFVQRRHEAPADPGTHFESRGLVGVAGAVSFTVIVAHAEVPRQVAHLYPMAVDLGQHARKRYFDWMSDEPMEEKCWLLDGPCFYDGSTLAAMRVKDYGLLDDEAALWLYLAGYYRSVFADVATESPLGAQP